MALASSSSSSSSSLAAIVGVATAVSTLSLLTFGFVLGSVVFVEDKVVYHLTLCCMTCMPIQFVFFTLINENMNAFQGVNKLTR
ncbi:hypothetical protein BC829DRAFT_397855 [Chytridium lagenaria]|nr:hypothetical protein BC829DRAFT_397855 [Chytridium lagenaria]